MPKFLPVSIGVLGIVIDPLAIVSLVVVGTVVHQPCVSILLCQGSCNIGLRVPRLVTVARAWSARIVKNVLIYWGGNSHL